MDNENNGKVKEQKQSGCGTIVVIAIIVIALFLFFKGCGGDGTGKKSDYLNSDGTPDFIWLLTISETEVEKYLVSPKTAKFSFNRNDWEIVNTGKRYKMQSFVDSQNSFGAMVRNKFIVIVEFKDDTYEQYSTETVEINGEKLK